jgi:hypothetical protein
VVFKRDENALAGLLQSVAFEQGRLIGRMEGLGFPFEMKQNWKS